VGGHEGRSEFGLRSSALVPLTPSQEWSDLESDIPAHDSKLPLSQEKSEFFNDDNSSSSPSSQDPQSQENLESPVDNIRFFVLHLHAIVHTAVFETHMEMVADNLQKDPIKAKAKAKSYTNWLWLLVSHYEAIYYFRKLFDLYGFSSISLRVVAIPFAGRDMMPWRKSIYRLYGDTQIKHAEQAITAIEDQSRRSGFFMMNLGENTPLSTGLDFTGTIHCETCTISFKLKDSKISESIRLLFAVSCILSVRLVSS
jgi:hypothetical protein